MVKEVVAINRKNKNTLWQGAIQKEMENMKITFQTILEGKKPHNWFLYVNCHMVFDIKVEDFLRKTC